VPTNDAAKQSEDLAAIVPDFFPGGVTMGGDNRGDTGNTIPDNATQHVLDGLNAKLNQDAGQQPPPQTRADYGGTVAPLAENPGQKRPGTDAFYHGGNGGPTRANYGPSGTLVPGGGGNQTGGGPEKVIPFQQAHADQARNPNQPYEPSQVGQQAAQQANQGAGRPGGGQPVDTNESRIMSAISKRGQYLSPWTPVFGGLGSVTAPVTARILSKGADGLVERTKPGSIPSNIGKYWQDNYDVTKVGKGDLIKPVAKTAEAESKFADLVEAERKVAGTEGPAQALAKERLEMLNRPFSSTTTADIAATNAARVKAGGEPLFSEAEMATIDGKYAAGLSRAAQEKAVIDGLQKTPPSAWTAIKAGVVGVGVDILAVNADRSIAKAIGGENSLLHSWNTEQILAPTALALGETLVGKSFWGKAALVAGTIGVSRLVDGGTQAVGLGAPEKWNAVTGVMNGWDGFGIATGLAIAASAKNPYAKVAAVAAGWAIPKVVHLFEDSSSNALAYKYEALTDKISSDHKSRSYGSLEDVTKASEDLNAKKEDWLVGKIASNRNTIQQQWGNMSPDQKLLAFRDDAGMSVAIGEDLLKKGTRVSSQGDPKYTLGGYEMDLGGRAMHYLISGKDSTDRAEQMTAAIIKNNSDSSKQKILVNGSEPTQSEVDGLEKFKGNIKADLSKIFDQKHDVQAVVNQVVKDVPPSSDDWRRTYITPTDGLIEHYAPRNQPDQAAETRQVIGKLYRDQAIAYLAFAEYKIEHGEDGQGALSLLMNNSSAHDIFPSGRQKNYNGAEGTLKMAQLFDPDAKDLPEIQQIWQAEVAKAQALAAKQMSDPNNNILNVDGKAPRPAGQ
jgi:hypothetical protein